MEFDMPKILGYGIAGVILLGFGVAIGMYKAVLWYRFDTIGLFAFFLSLFAWIGIWRLAVELAGYVNVRYGKPMINGLIPNPIDQNPWAHWRSPMDMMRQG